MTPTQPVQVGDIVNYHSIIGGPATSTGHRVNAIWPMPNDFGCAVAKVSGKSGVVAVDSLSKMEGNP